MSNKLKKNKPAGEQEEPWKKKEKDQPAWKKHLQVLIIAIVLVALSVLTPQPETSPSPTPAEGR